MSVAQVAAAEGQGVGARCRCGAGGTGSLQVRACTVGATGTTCCSSRGSTLTGTVLYSVTCIGAISGRQETHLVGSCVMGNAWRQVRPTQPSPQTVVHDTITAGVAHHLPVHHATCPCTLDRSNLVQVHVCALLRIAHCRTKGSELVFYTPATTTSQ